MLVQVCAFRFVCQSFQVLHNALVIMLLSLSLNRRDRSVEISRETTPKAIKGNTGGTASSHARQTSNVFPDDDDVELHALGCRVDIIRGIIVASAEAWFNVALRPQKKP